MWQDIITKLSLAISVFVYIVICVHQHREIRYVEDAVRVIAITATISPVLYSRDFINTTEVFVVLVIERKLEYLPWQNILFRRSEKYIQPVNIRMYTDECGGRNKMRYFCLMRVIFHPFLTLYFRYEGS